MSDAAQGPGWYQASDGKWYPPPGWYQASDGRWYPPQTPSSPPPYGTASTPTKTSRGCLYATLAVIGVFLVLIVGIFLTIGLSAKKIHNIASNGNLGGSAPAAQYKVGDTATTARLAATVFAVNDPQPPLNNMPPASAGRHFVSVDVQIANQGTTATPFIPLLYLHLLDRQNQQYTVSANAGATGLTPADQIAPGQSIRGSVVFEVPDGTTGLKLRVQGSLTAAGAVFKLQ